MSRWASLAKMIDEIDKPESRVKPRFIARQLVCDCSGTVLDFSASGLRVVYKKKPEWNVGDHVELTLESTKATHRGLAIVRRITKMGFRNYEVGFEFSDPEAAKKMQLFKSGYDALDDDMWSAA
ncbi:MAG: PilZ domain-containing protein [Phycisphaerales bacterium]|nr:PilZ domain-containing protein [Phycisphaerales bacterium]